MDKNLQNLGCQSLEESPEALVLHQIFDDGQTALLGLEVLVLDAGLRYKRNDFEGVRWRWDETVISWRRNTRVQLKSARTLMTSRG